MLDYVPTPEPLPGVPWLPSNGTGGACFHASWCSNCKRDKDMNGTCHREGREADESDWCPILCMSFCQPVSEWRDLGERHVCLAFVHVDSDEPLVRCEHTRELF